jgi:circadian clock protein KaiC
MFIDMSPHAAEEGLVTEDYDLSALLARIEYSVRTIGAKRIAIDSLGAVFSQLAEDSIIRQDLLRIAVALKKMSVTAVMTG